ncbi:MAG: helix-turn-helix transcriptional regulator [Elusimicrobiota bacterium]|nr:helix-turn-helix transcriptional regulator [Elusimicrobiota bacterium]
MTYNADEGLLIRIGRKIRILRESSHMTQGVLAKKLRFKKEAVARIEKGEYNMLMNTLFKIAHIFGRRLKITFVKRKGGV